MLMKLDDAKARNFLGSQSCIKSSVQRCQSAKYNAGSDGRYLPMKSTGKGRSAGARKKREKSGEFGQVDITAEMHRQ